MRLRKNIKLTASMIWSTAASPSSPNPPEELMQSHVCVLNRSPWDAPLSPPRDYPLSAAADAEDSLPSPQHHHNNNQVMEEDDTDTYPPLNDDSLPPDDDSLRSIDSMKISSDPDNKSSSSMSILPTPTPTPPSPALNTNAKDPKDKAGSSMGPPRRRGRPKKVVAQPPPSTSTATPNEFYYYSGFGPRWGKRRGCDHLKQPASANIEDKGGDKRKIRVERTDEELDYIDDDYEDDDEQVDGSRKRTRKLVKARSLKSLM